MVHPPIAPRPAAATDRVAPSKGAGMTSITPSFTPASGRAFGIDIGGTGIKGAVVETGNGKLLTERIRIPTPQPATPDAIAGVVAELVSQAEWRGEIGATFPAIIKHGVAKSAANVDPAWIDTDADKTFTDAVGAGSEVVVLNDADAAGIAEARFGAAKGVSGVVILLTFGTGIGSALLMNGVLVPNTELGHLELDGHDAERRAAASVRDEHGMSYKKWAARVEPLHAARRAAVHPRPVRGRRRRQQELREVGAAARTEHPGRAGAAAERGRHRRCRDRRGGAARRIVPCGRARAAVHCITRELRTIWTRTEPTNRLPECPDRIASPCDAVLAIG